MGLTQLVLAPDNEQWATTMEQYALVAGRPAFAAQQYEDPRAKASFAQYDHDFHQHNLAIIADLEHQFEQRSAQYQQALPEQFKQAVAYAKQQDGATFGKQYPVIEEPAVWTPTSKERYNDQVRMQQQERAFDELIQQTFDWLFAQVGRESQLTSSNISVVNDARWVNNLRQQTLTLSSTFDNEKILDLVFVIESEKVNRELFESLETIMEASNIKRQSLDIQRNQPRALLAGNDNFEVYSPAEKTNLFFSPFRADASRVVLNK